MPRILFFMLCTLIAPDLFSQNKVREQDILFQKSITRSIPICEKNNEILFGKNNTLVTVLLEAYEKGSLKGFNEAACVKELSWNEFRNRIQLPSVDDTVYFYNSTQLNVVELTEDLIVDKHRSEIVFCSRAFTVFLPASINHKGIHEPVVSFRYEDCEKLFREDKRAQSSNPFKNGRNINYAEIFLLHAYTSSIVKMGGAEDLYFDQKSDSTIQAFLEGKKSENELTEYLFKLFNPR